MILLGTVFVGCKHEIKVACVGDSITEGAGMADQSKTAYPVQLKKILGSGYEVLNCGRSGATMLKSGDLPLWKCKELYNVFEFKPNIIIITLGTNDSKNFNWNAIKFERDYQAMIDTFKTIASKPRICLCLPPPVFKKAWGIDDSTIVYGIVPVIEKLAKANNLSLIDLNSKMRTKVQVFPDGVHPDESGANIMAGIIAGDLKTLTLY